MISIKKKSLLITVAALLIVVIGTSTYLNRDVKTDVRVDRVVNLSANAITFNSVDKLDEFAELILVGYATDEFAEREHVVTTFEDGTMESFHTNTNIKIEKILKKPSDFPSDQDELIIIEPVSYKDGVKYTADNYIELQKGDRSVIFLMKNTFGDYGLINDNLGKFSLETENPSTSIQSFTTQELSEYETFRQSVFNSYNLN